MNTDMEVATEAQPPTVQVPTEEVADTPKSSTLYCQNLNERIKPPVLKATLSNLFSNYGPLLSVTAHKNLRMRGQAFVAFASLEDAEKAKKEATGFPLYGKPMMISYARTESDSVVKKEKGEEELAKWVEERKTRKKATRYDNPLKSKMKMKRLASLDPTQVAAANKRPNVMMPDEYLPPNKILFVQNLPTDLEGGQEEVRQKLSVLFTRYPNLHEIRLIPTKKDIAFVEFADEDSATVAKDALHNYKIVGDQKIKITFARK